MAIHQLGSVPRAISPWNHLNTPRVKLMNLGPSRSKGEAWILPGSLITLSRRLFQGWDKAVKAYMGVTGGYFRNSPYFPSCLWQSFRNTPSIFSLGFKAQIDALVYTLLGMVIISISFLMNHWVVVAGFFLYLIDWLLSVVDRGYDSCM